MRTKYLTQSLIEQMRCTMIIFGGCTFIFINNSLENRIKFLWQLTYNVYCQTIFFLCVQNLRFLPIGFNISSVAHLTTHFSIKRCTIKNQLIKTLTLSFNLTITPNFYFRNSVIITHKIFGRKLLYLAPIATIYFCIVTATFFLLCKF